MVTRRELLKGGVALASAAAGASLLAACGSAGTAGSSTAAIPKTADIQVAWWGSALRDQLTEQVIKDFEQKHSGWTATGTFIAGTTSFFNEMNVKAAANNLPDVIQLGGSYVPQYADEHQLLNLNSYKNGKPFDLTGFDQGQLNQGTVNGKLYAVTLGGNMPAILYNQTLIEQAGMSPPSDKMTWDEFATYCKQLQSKLPSGVYALDDNSGTGGPGMEVWIRQRQDLVYTASGQLAYGTSVVESWLNWWKALRDAKAVVPGTVEAAAIQNGANQGTPLALGKAVFYFIWSNYITQFPPLLPGKTLAMIPYPKGGKQAGDFLQASQFFGVSAHSKYPYVAASFINFCVNDKNALQTLGVERGVPAAARTQKIVESAPDVTSYEKQEIAFLLKYGPGTRPLPRLDPPNAGALTMLSQNMAQSVALGTASVPSAAQTYITAAKKALATQSTP